MARDENPARPPRPAPPRTGKPPELEDWLNARLFHPAAARLAALLERTPVTPNAVSVAGGVTVIAAGLLYTQIEGALGVVLGFCAHAFWHVLDGADGDLARRTGKASARGELVDGICDYVSHALLYVLLATVLDDWIGGWAWALGWAAGLSRVAQSHHAESRRRTYLWRVYGVPWLKHAQAARDEVFERPGPVTRFFTGFARAYVAAATNPLAAQVDDLVTAPSHGRRAVRLCRRASRRALRLQTWLGANLRTVALGISMAAGSPLWFFLFELIPLNLLLLVSSRLQARCDRSLADRLQPRHG